MRSSVASSSARAAVCSGLQVDVDRHVVQTAQELAEAVAVLTGQRRAAHELTGDEPVSHPQWRLVEHDGDGDRERQEGRETSHQPDLVA
jgi:hypothetical protein